MRHPVDPSAARSQIPIELKENQLHVAACPIQLLRQEELSPRIWAELAVDVVFECTARVKSRAGAQVHLDAGAGRVLISIPADFRADATVVFGVNHHELTGNDVARYCRPPGRECGQALRAMFQKAPALMTMKG